MSSWYTTLVLLAILFLSAHVFSESSPEIQQRITYITPEDSNSRPICPVNYCYNLQDVFSNSSYFFYSYTTLELLPGVYNITENLNKLVLFDLKNFTFRGSSPNVTITCQSGATWGLIIVRSQNVEISNIQIKYCSTKSQIALHDHYLTPYDKQLRKYLGYNLSSCDTKINTKWFPACFTFLASFKNENLTVFEITILHSKGVGILSLDDKELDISHSTLAYNQINCIAFVVDTTNTIINIFKSQMEFGQLKSDSFKFASGMNLFVQVGEETHTIRLNDITLRDNKGEYGNFHMVVRALSMSFDPENIRVNVQITNMTSLQTWSGYAYGLVVKYNIQLNEYKSSLFPLVTDYCTSFSRFDPDCYPWFSWSPKWTLSKPFKIWPKRVDIVLRNSHFIGSCVVIKDSALFIEGYGIWFWFEMNNITIKSKQVSNSFFCPQQ